jgi:acyl-CoA thioesterase II
MTTFTDLVEVEALGSERYRAVTDSPLTRPTLFGGALLAQALRAAAASTDPEKHPHSLHATFVRAGQAGNGVEFQVTRTRDGRSFSTRQVTVSQGERFLATVTASFHRDEPSPEYERAADRPVPYLDDEILAARASRGPSALGIDVVDVSEPGEPRYLAWARSQHPLPADRVLHACAMAYASDSGAPGVAATAIGLLAGGPDVPLRARAPDEAPRGRLRHRDASMTASLDHAIWFHRAGRCDDWFLVSAIPLSTAGSRGLVLGSLRDRSGRHLASFTQEMLIRVGQASARPVN